MNRRRFLKNAAGLFVPALPALILPKLACAQLAGGLQFPGPGTPHTTGGAAVTFDPAHKGTNQVLSGGNLTVTGGSGAQEAVIATVGATTGKKYWESPSNATNSFNNRIGISLLAGAGDSPSLSNIAEWLADGRFIINGTDVGGMYGFNQGSNDNSLAVDLGANLIWARAGVSNWNNNASADPATGVGGFNVSPIATGTLYPWASTNATNDVWTVNFGATAYIRTPPSGFGNW